MEVRATAKQVPISPRKVGLIADVIRGKKVADALPILTFLPTPSARAVAKVVKSAAANAENNYQMAPEELKIVKISVDEGRTLKRYRPRSRGRVSPLLKRSCHITVVVGEA